MPNQHSASGYTPGVCNIGPWEIRRRILTGVLFLLISLLFGYYNILHGWPRYTRLLEIIPLTISSLAFLQAGTKFCAGYGLMGVQNFGIGRDKRIRIADAEMLKKDRAQSKRHILCAFLIGLTIAVFFFAMKFW